MEVIYLIICLVMYVLGIATGMYAASQIEEDINKRTKNK